MAPGSTIPTASMADISFLLLIFFIVSTVFIRYRPNFQADLPEAASVELLKNRRNIANMWISADGLVQIDSALVNMDDVGALMLKKLQRNPQLIVLVKADERSRYGVVSQAIEQLRTANALRIAFAARTRGRE
jgi:biopolymer transport protein ExbD